ncbi:MAG: PD-(D/E)XK nuclease family protein [Candidatus Micrarchaeota archaeon]
MAIVNGKLTNEFSWSVSGDKLFSECKRKYYYDRYGSWEGWARGTGSLKAKELYLLKKLSLKDQWVGARVHDIIKMVLEKTKRGKAVSLVEAENYLEGLMKLDFQQSRENLYLKNPKLYVRFFEHEYGIPLEEKDAIASTDFGKHCLKNFFESEIFAQLKQVRTSDWLGLDDEKPSGFAFEGSKIFVKLDAAVRQENRITIFDWKTNRKPDVDYSIQLACYLLYATRTWKASASNVDVFEVNLAQERAVVKKHPGLVAGTDWIQEYMRKSISAMKSLLKNAEKNEAEERDYPQINELRYCSRCKFLRVCKPDVLPDGKVRG